MQKHPQKSSFQQRIFQMKTITCTWSKPTGQPQVGKVMLPAPSITDRNEYLPRCGKLISLHRRFRTQIKGCLLLLLLGFFFLQPHSPDNFCRRELDCIRCSYNICTRFQVGEKLSQNCQSGAKASLDLFRTVRVRRSVLSIIASPYFNTCTQCTTIKVCSNVSHKFFRLICVLSSARYFVL